MKILVTVKRVLDHSMRVRVRNDKTGVDLNNLKMSMNPFDEIVVEEAVRLKEQGRADEVVAVSVGSVLALDTLRTAIAMGADRGILIKTTENVESLGVAKLLVKLVETEKPDLIFLGKQSIDGDNNQTGQMLAARLGWPQATFANKVSLDGKRVTVVREIDGGFETVELKLPAVITADLRLNEPRYATLPSVMKAKKKPIQELSPEAMGVDIAPRLTVLAVEEPPLRKQGIMVPNVATLVQKLHLEAGVI